MKEKELLKGLWRFEVDWLPPGFFLKVGENFVYLCFEEEDKAEVVAVFNASNTTREMISGEAYRFLKTKK